MAKASKKKSKNSTIKSVKRSTSKKGGKVTKVIHESTKEIKVEKALIDNFIALQKVMVNLSLKFDSISTQISKLLELFDISAKALAKKEFETEKESNDTHKIMQRLDNIAQQAGLIGKGLALIHEVSKEDKEETEKKIREIQEPNLQRPMPRPNPSSGLPSANSVNPPIQKLPSTQQQATLAQQTQKLTLDSKTNSQPNPQSTNEKQMP